MDTSNFDWWLLVVVPGAVSIAVYYLQKLLDRGAIRGLRTVQRRRLKKRIQSSAITFVRIAEGTFMFHFIRSIFMSMLMGFLVILSTISYMVLSNSINSSMTTAQACLLILFALLALFSWLCVGHIVSETMNMSTTYSRLIREVSELKLNIEKLSPGEFDIDLQLMTLIAFREDKSRNELTAEAVTPLSDDEKNELMKRFI